MVAANEAFESASLLRVAVISSKSSFTAVNIPEAMPMALVSLSMYPATVLAIWVSHSGVVTGRGSKMSEGVRCCATAPEN